jgi:hypothetical protein
MPSIYRNGRERASRERLLDAIETEIGRAFGVF